VVDVPIKPDLIVWAREHRGLTQEELAEKLRLPLADLIALESGEKLANLTIFKSLSKKLRIPGGSLLRETRPNVAPMPADFRTFDGRPPEIGFETRLAVNYARTIAENIKELVENEIAPPAPMLRRFNRQNDDPEQCGESERERLGISAVTQMGWDSGSAFRNWRTIIESAGTFVLLKNFPHTDCKGFTLYDDRETPIIVVSKHDRVDVARAFTLLHEYAHLLIREPGVSDLNDRNPVEYWCNRFAAAFLMPRNMLRDLIGAWPNEPIEWTLPQIANWARRLKVSQQALSLRFEGLGLAPVGFYDRICAQQERIERRQTGSGGSYVNIQINELGDHFAKTVLDAHFAEQIKPFEASEILSVRPVYFDQIRQRIENQQHRVGVG